MLCFSLVPPTKEEKGTYKWSLSVCPSIRSSVRPFVTAILQHYLDGFLWIYEEQNMSKKIPNCFFNKVLFSSHFWKYACLGVLRCFGQKKLGPKWVKTGLKAGHRIFFRTLFEKVLFFSNIWKYLHHVSYRGTHDTFTCLFITWEDLTLPCLNKVGGLITWGRLHFWQFYFCKFLVE